MTLKLYSLSGSPFGWKVQLALAAKAIVYDIEMLSPQRGDLAKPEFRALNPHVKLPVLVDGDFVLFESDAIADYVAEGIVGNGTKLWPLDTRARAQARRLAIEASSYLYPPTRALVSEWLLKGSQPADPVVVAHAIDTASVQLAAFALDLQAPFFSGDSPGLADFAIYPLVALQKRLAAKRPESDLGARMPAGLLGWSGRIEALAYFDATYPPHWRA